MQKRYLFPTITALSIVALTGTATVQAQNNMTQGPYVSVSLGASGIDYDSIGRAEVGDTERDGTAGKIAAGYWITPHIGVEANAVELGDFEQKFTGAGTHRGSARSYGVSLLGRVPMGENWSVVGKINLSRTEIKDNGSTGNTSGFDTLRGRESSLVLPGLEINYSFTPNSTVFLEVDPRGSAADDVDLGYAGVGWRLTF